MALLSFRIATVLLAATALFAGCGQRQKNAYKSVTLKFGALEVYYHIYPNQSQSERAQGLVLNGVGSLPATIDLRSKSGNELTLNNVTIEQIREWGKDTLAYADHFEAGKGGTIKCNSNSVSFTFHADGTVKEVTFDTIFNPAPVKLTSNSGQTIWPCNRDALEKIFGKPDKETIYDRSVAGP